LRDSSFHWKNQGGKQNPLSPTRLRGRSKKPRGRLKASPRQEGPTEKKKLSFIEREAMILRERERERERACVMFY